MRNQEMPSHKGHRYSRGVSQQSEELLRDEVAKLGEIPMAMTYDIRFMNSKLA